MLDASGGVRFLSVRMGSRRVGFAFERVREWVKGARAQAIGRGLLLISPAFALWLLLVVTGLRGVDYGLHWDEGPFHLAPVRNAVASGILLPRSYIYPTFDKWLVLWPSLVVTLRTGLDTAFDTAKMQQAMLAAVDAPTYLLSVRRIFIVLSSLGVFWMYGAALALRMKWWVALLAASGIALSWEHAYHARFVAADCLLTQFTALVLFLVAVFMRTGKKEWLYAASVAAGLGTGTKYTGVFLLLPILLASSFTLPRKKIFAHALRGALLCGSAFVAYLVITPGTLLDPFAFIWETRFITKAYEGSHGGYTAAGGWDHGRIVFQFLSLAYFSAYRPLAIALFALAIVGIGFWIRGDWRTATLLLICPVTFLITFCSNYRIVTVRNYLWVAPFLSLFMARAVMEAHDRLRWSIAKKALYVVLVALALLQATWLVRAGESIRRVNPNAYVRRALAYVARHAETRFHLSPQVVNIATSRRMTIPPNVGTTKESSEIVFFARAEGPGPWEWKSNDPFQTKAVFGPHEVNFSWYTSWAGTDRVVVMTIEKARATLAPVAR